MTLHHMSRFPVDETGNQPADRPDPSGTRDIRLQADAVGVGFKPEHAEAIDTDPGALGFLEVHAENYMGDGGAPHRLLGRMRERFALSLHGVSMSLGGPSERLDPDHLARFARLVERYDPALVSEHLAWSTHDDIFYNDLLPLPYTDATLQRVCDHVDEMQEAIGRTILLENPATYVLFDDSTLAETEFMAQIAERTGCGLLLDVNNVFVSATNHGFSAGDYLAKFPLHAVGEIHLAGHVEQTDDNGAPLLIDSHNRPVADPVWQLYELVLQTRSNVPTLVEWDSDLPEWPVLRDEIGAAKKVQNRIARLMQPLGRRHG